MSHNYLFNMKDPVAKVHKCTRLYVPHKLHISIQNGGGLKFMICENFPIPIIAYLEFSKKKTLLSINLIISIYISFDFQRYQNFPKIKHLWNTSIPTSFRLWTQRKEATTVSIRY